MAAGTKSIAEETRDRRIEVFRLKMRGLNHSAIARELQCSRKTVIRDAQWIEANMREIALDADRYTEIGEAMSWLKEIAQDALFHMAEAEKPSEKNGFLKTAADAIDKRLRLMMDAGIIERAAVDLNLNIPDLLKLSTMELEAKRDELINRLRATGTSVN